MVGDEELVNAAKAGDREAFASLVSRYSAAVRAVAFHVCHDYHASEDIAQDSFVSAYQRLASLRVPSLFGRWILKIARHQALRSERGAVPELPLEHADETACPEHTSVDTEYVLSQVMRLSEREQRLLMLRYFNGHSINEIAKITGRPVGTVTKQLSRGYARLRERLAEELI